MADRVPARRSDSSVRAAQPRGLLSLVHHMEPERLLKRYGEAVSMTSKVLIEATNLGASGSDRQRLLTGLSQCLSVEVLRAMAAELDAALVMEPDRAAVQASIAVLFDARVRGPQNPQIYLDALAFDLIDEGFPPAVVVAACQTLRREAVYMPEISEILAACRAKLSTYRAVANHAGRLAGIRAQLEARLGGMP